ncbi:MAG: hypothetical protein IJQ28_02345, partial [Clostridia bacterium]|nr:hypothetical protein [Clostridia bacterium]
MYIPYKLADGTTALVEVTEEVAEFIVNDDRKTENADRRQRYHCPYHIEAIDYEGTEYAYHKSPEQIYIMKEEAEHIQNTLSFLSDKQFCMLYLKAQGLSLREIAKREGTTVNAVNESLQ